MQLYFRFGFPFYCYFLLCTNNQHYLFYALATFASGQTIINKKISSRSEKLHQRDTFLFLLYVSLIYCKIYKFIDPSHQNGGFLRTPSFFLLLMCIFSVFVVAVGRTKKIKKKQGNTVVEGIPGTSSKRKSCRWKSKAYQTVDTIRYAGQTSAWSSA